MEVAAVGTYVEKGGEALHKRKAIVDLTILNN